MLYHIAPYILLEKSCFILLGQLKQLKNNNMPYGIPTNFYGALLFLPRFNFISLNENEFTQRCIYGVTKHVQNSKLFVHYTLTLFFLLIDLKRNKIKNIHFLTRKWTYHSIIPTFPITKRVCEKMPIHVEFVLIFVFNGLYHH